MTQPDTSIRKHNMDYFTLIVTGAAVRIEELREEIKHQKKIVIEEIERGIKEGRTTGNMVIMWYIRGTIQKEQRHAKFSRFIHGGSWIYIRLYRKDGTLGDHEHMIDTDDIVAFETMGA